MTAFWLSNSKVKILKGVGKVEEEEEEAAKKSKNFDRDGLSWSAAHDSDLQCLVCVDVFDFARRKKRKSMTICRLSECDLLL